MKLIFERGSAEQHLTLLPACDVPEVHFEQERQKELHLPHLCENELTRHYTEIAKRVHDRKALQIFLDRQACVHVVV